LELVPRFEQLEQKHLSLVRLRMLARAEELRGLPAEMPDEALVAALLEVKQLEAYTAQDRLRSALVAEMQKASVLASTSEPRLYKRAHTSEAMLDEEAASDAVNSAEQQQLRLQQRAFLGAVLNHAREMAATRVERKSFMRGLTTKLLKEYDKSQRKRQLEEQQLERDRLQKLREVFSSSLATWVPTNPFPCRATKRATCSCCSARRTRVWRCCCSRRRTFWTA
jgi:hypothetical protein